MRLGVSLIVASVLLAGVGGVWFFASGTFLGFGIAREWAAIRAKIDELTTPATAQEVCRDLARLGMTYHAHPEWFAPTSQNVAYPPPWTPASVRHFEPRHADIRDDLVSVEFGGGFFHYGYGLTPAGPAGPDGSVTWVLSLYQEESPSRELCRITLTPADALSPAEMGRNDK